MCIVQILDEVCKSVVEFMRNHSPLDFYAQTTDMYRKFQHISASARDY
jgi:hypothetical protein